METLMIRVGGGLADASVGSPWKGLTIIPQGPTDLCFGSIRLSTGYGYRFASRKYNPGVVNSTQASASIRPVQLDRAGIQSLTLVAGGMPALSFGYIMHVQGHGFFADPAGPQGNL